MNGLVMINGELIKADKAHIPAFDRGFLFGDSVYEILAAKNGRILDFAAHLNRLRRSAAEVAIPLPWTDEFLLFEIEHLVESLEAKYISIRLVITRGSGGALIPEQELKPNRYIFAAEANEPMVNLDQSAVKLKTKRIGSFQKGAHIKSNAYLETVAAGIQAKKEGYDDVLWMSPEGEFTEAGTANIFFISREGDLVEIATPPAASGLLEGITRNRTIALLRMAKIPVVERVIAVEELPRFDEAFISSSIRALRPVVQIDRHRLHTTRSQAVFRHIARLYKAWLESDADGSLRTPAQ